MRVAHFVSAGTRHALSVGMQALLIAAIVGVLALGFSAVYQPAGLIAGLGDADAGRTTASISVPDGAFGGTTTATVNPGDSVVYFACFRGGERVMAAYKATDANNQATVKLGPTPSWLSGEATCIAQEGTRSNSGRWRVLAETTFYVAP